MNHLGSGETVLVTGGAGFIGSNFLFHWIRRHPADRIICADSLTYAGNLKTLEPLFTEPGFLFEKADIADAAEMDRIFRTGHPDVVVNFAAESHVDRSLTQADVFLRTNVKGVHVLLETAQRYGVRRFHQIGTDEVYGGITGTEMRDETAMLYPSNPYSASKAAADHLVLAYYRTYGLPVTISRSSNNYGPFQYPEKLIPHTLTEALRGNPVPVYGNGKNLRDWIHVLDHCRAVELILEKGKPGEIYNVSANCEITNIDLVHRIGEIAGLREMKIRFTEDRKGHDFRYGISSEKIRRELGWKPEIPFVQGLEDTVHWYLEHPEWWEPLAE